MSTPEIILCVAAGVLIGAAIDYVSGHKRAKERAELAAKVVQSEPELREWWIAPETITVQVDGQQIVYTRQPRGISEQAIRDLLDWEDKRGGLFGAERPSEEQSDGHLPQDSPAAR